MWKKLFLGLIVFVSVFSVSYIYYNINMYATSNSGSISSTPITAHTGGLRKGDRVTLDSTKIDLEGKANSWLLTKNITGIKGNDETTVPITRTAPYDAWFTMASESIDHAPLHTSQPTKLFYKDTTLAALMASYNQQLNSSARDMQFVSDRIEVRNTDATTADAKVGSSLVEIGKKMYIPQKWEVMGVAGGTKIVTANELSFFETYWFSNASDSLSSNLWNVVNSNGSTTTASSTPITLSRGVRPALNLSFQDVVFSAEQINNTGAYYKVEAPVAKTHLYQSSGNAMKVRVHNSALDMNFTDIQKNGKSITQITKGSTVELIADAPIGSDSEGQWTVSVLIYDSSGNLVYYRPLENAKGSGTYKLNLGDIPVSKYKIALVNESYNENNDSPADCSSITATKDLEIVEQLSDLNFQAQNNLQVNNNVNVGDKVGVISSKYGIGIPNYSIVEDSAYAGEYAYFEIASDNKTVIVDGNPLNAGTYHFKIQAQDENGDPDPALEISASITVSKTNLSVAFDDPNQTKKSVTDAATPWSETATASPSDGVKITYSKVGGDISLIDIDPDSGGITYKGNGSYGKVTIRATADDDPNTGNDNYNSSYVEKEIVVYAQVDGSVTPDPKSSDANEPTFTANDANVKTGGTIGTIKGEPGTPDDVSGSKITYTYGIKSDGNGSFFAVNSSTGVITTKANLGVDTYHITVTVSDKWSTKEIPVTINVGMSAAENLKFYESSSSNTIINTKSAKVTDTNVVVYATVKGSTNTNPVTYKIKDGSTNVIEVNQSSGAITIHGVGTVTIVAEKQGASGQANASAELTFTVTAGAQNFIYTDSAGNELPKSGNNYSAKTEEYAPNKTFQLYTAGNPTGTNVTYQLKAGAPTDVISVDASGLVTILNATQTAQTGKVIVQATSHDPTGNYEDKTIELPINIDKGTRTIAFAENPIYVVSGKGQVVPVTEVDGVTDTDGDVLIEIDSNEDHTIAWTNDNKTIDYNYSGEEGKDIKIHATKPMNRNYKLAETDGTLHIMGPDESMLAITSPGQIIYGDHFTIRSTQFDADSTNVQYTFEVDKTTFISSPTVSGNSAQFDALKASGTNKTTVTVTRTANGEAPLSKKVQVTVLPKPIEIMIDDKEKLKGEQNPSLTYQDFRSDLVSWNGVQDSIQENDIKLSTTAKTDSNAGDYPIKGDNNTLNRTYPNYSFTFKEGTLTINEETIEDDWYHLELDDGNSTVYTGNWTNQDVNIISDHNEYINMSLDQSTWNPNQVTVSREGETNQDFWMKKDSGAITKVKQEIIRIDKTAPKVKNIKAKDSNNKLQDIINKLSGGIFFKPGTAFEITTSDTKDDLKVSGTKEIAYKVFKLESQTRATEELIKEGNLTVTNEKASITISETTGKYKVCVTATDNAGNTSTESCHEAELKKIDVDVDKDGKPDFNDPDGDGCPDLNIKWKDPNDETKWVVINGDRNNDKIPDLNIDSDGDGIPDLNIDTDNDGKPDLNLVILKKSDWKPTKCVKADIDNGILEEYCTGTGVKAVINVDTDNDRIPNINIDNKGDFKPHLNISKDGVNASVNITDVHEWKPEKNYTSGKFTFDSVGNEYKPQINVDSDGDGRPDINIDLDEDGVPDINIDTDDDNIPNINIDSDGDGIPDVNVDIDDDGNPDENIKDITEWKPNKDVDGDVPYDTMDFSEQEEPEKPSEPTKPNQPANGTDVKGSYYPGDNVGGAITGDETNLLLYIDSILFSVGLISYLIYRTQKDTFQ